MTVHRGDRYTHTKSGKLYSVLGVCINKTSGQSDGQTMIRYSAVGDLSGPEYVRTEEEFLGKFHVTTLRDRIKDRINDRP